MVRKNKNAVVVKSAIYKEAKKQGASQISAKAVASIENQLASDLRCLVGQSLRFTKHANLKKIRAEDVKMAADNPSKTCR